MRNHCQGFLNVQMYSTDEITLWRFRLSTSKERKFFLIEKIGGWVIQTDIFLENAELLLNQLHKTYLPVLEEEENEQINEKKTFLLQRDLFLCFLSCYLNDEPELVKMLKAKGAFIEDNTLYSV